jgi:flagellar hook-associated protein 2
MMETGTISMATDYLSALNVGSGLNTAEIVDSLVNADVVPKQNIINAKIDDRNVSISALGQLQTDLKSFDTNLAAIDGMIGLSVSSSGTATSLEVTNSSSANDFSHKIEVANIATSQTLVFNGFSSEDDELGAGSLAISFGTWSGGSFTQNSSSTETITITDGANTLADIRNAINDADIGLTASIIQVDTQSFSLMVKSTTGLDNAIQIVATETVSNTGLANLDYSSYDSNVELVAATDASFSLDGIEITRDTNTITDLLDGMTLTLNHATSTEETITSAYSSSEAYVVMQALVKEINTLSSSLRTLSQRGLNGASDGPLVGDPIVAQLTNSLRSISTDAIYGFGDDAIYMASFGVQTQKDGSVILDEDTFTKAFEENPSGFAAIVMDRFTASTSGVEVLMTGTDWVGGVYDLVYTDANNVTIDSVDMTVSDTIYTSSSGSTNGLILDIGSNVGTASVYLGRSALSTLRLSIAEYLVTGSDIDNKITTYSDDISDYETDLVNLTARMESLRNNYTEKFSAMNAALENSKSSGVFLTNMMDAWKSNLKS